MEENGMIQKWLKSTQASGSFGEKFIAALFEGEIVGQDNEYRLFADVLIREAKLGIQVKMGGNKNPLIIRAEQIINTHEKLAKSTKPSFLTEREGEIVLKHAVYALVFYNGFFWKKANRGKSMLSDPTLTKAQREFIISQQLRSVYVVDVRMVNFFLHNVTDMQSTGRLLYHADRQNGSKQELQMGRTILKSLHQDPKRRHTFLKECFKRGGGSDGMVRKQHLKLHYKGVGEVQREIPLYIMGRSDTVKVVQSIVLPEHEFFFPGVQGELKIET